MELSNTAHLHLELKVLEKDVNKIDLGQEVTYFLQSDPGKFYKGDIHLIDKMVDENRMINVHTHIADPEPPHITTGMFVTAMIETEENEGIALPENAVVKLEGKEYVLGQDAENSYSFTPILVETGIRQNGYVQILSPIDTSANYLVKGGYYVLK
jgi:cobalt-zinc-cadmium efflux system membrane fusion protein